MNYIKRLEQSDKLRGDSLKAATELVEEFMIHLSSDKFIGTDIDGSRKDWIAVQDVRDRLAKIMYELLSTQ